MGNIINRVFESAGPDGKVRGTPQQIIDKYQALARDAQVAGDRVAAESYLQHSEHYSRLLGEAQRQQMENRSFSSRSARTASRGERRRLRASSGGRSRPMAQPVASGLTMIDPDDSDDLGGPIETPEGRRRAASTSRRRSSQPAPVARAAPNGGRQPQLAAARRPTPRPATRRPSRPSRAEAAGAGPGRGARSPSPEARVTPAGVRRPSRALRRGPRPAG